MSKYIKGEPIKSLDELVKQEFVYFGGKVVNIGWFQNWQIGMADLYIKYGYIYEAINLEDLGNEIFHEFLTLEDKYRKPLLEWLNNKNKNGDEMKVKCDKCGCFMKANFIKSDEEMIENGFPKEFLGSFICKKCGNGLWFVM